MVVDHLSRVDGGRPDQSGRWPSVLVGGLVESTSRSMVELLVGGLVDTKVRRHVEYNLVGVKVRWDYDLARCHGHQYSDHEANQASVASQCEVSVAESDGVYKEVERVLYLRFWFSAVLSNVM